MAIHVAVKLRAWILVLLSLAREVYLDEDEAQSGGFVQFNNPKLLQSISGDPYLYDAGQEPVDAKIIGGLNIHDETIKLGTTLSQLSNEMGVPHMQVNMYNNKVYYNPPYSHK